MPSRRTSLFGLALVLLVVAGGAMAILVAEQRALAAEEDHVAGRLENAPCLTDWGTSEGGGPSKDASVTKAVGFGVRVSVTMPYAYTTSSGNETIHADTASEAVYEVTLAGARRISGTEISPC